MAKRILAPHLSRNKKAAPDWKVPPRRMLALGAGIALLLFHIDVAPAQTIGIGSTAGNPGWLVSFDVSLDNQGNSVAGTQNDIFLDARYVPLAANAEGDPDCKVNPNIGKIGRFAFLPAGCTGSDCLQIRTLIYGLSDTSPIPNGVLYTCRVQISPTAPPDTYPLYIGRVRASTATGTALPAVGAAGDVLVEPPCGPCGCP